MDQDSQTLPDDPIPDQEADQAPSESEPARAHATSEAVEPNSGEAEAGHPAPEAVAPNAAEAEASHAAPEAVAPHSAEAETADTAHEAVAPHSPETQSEPLEPPPAAPASLADPSPKPFRSIVRFRPTGPWRIGPGSGARDQVDSIFHSDAIYSAVTSAMSRLGMLDEWIEATAKSQSGVPGVRFSSLFPYNRDTLFVVPPKGIWPPPASTKVRYKAARFVPVSVVETLLSEKPLDEDRWQVDGESGCLIPSNWQEGPFRTGLRSNAGVDRLNPGNVGVHSTACLEFTRDSGLWLMVVFADQEARSRWEQPTRAAFRLLADSGLGGERSRGWGRSSQPKWESAKALSFKPESEAPESAYWLLSLFSPADSDSIDWNRGNYSTLIRTGRIESPAQWGGAKAAAQMIAEGSVLMSPEEPRGSVRDIAPEHFPHPVYRAGFAVTVPIPWRSPA